MASVSKRKNPGVDGKEWAVRYVDRATGRRPSKQFRTKKEADAFKRKVEREMEDGVHVTAAESRTVGDAAEAYIEHLEQQVREGLIGESHLHRTGQAIRKYFVPSLGGILLRDLKPDHIFACTAEMKKHVHSATAKSYLEGFRQMERFARVRGWTKISPIADAKAEMRFLSKGRVKAIPPEHVSAIINVAGTRAKWEHPRGASLVECFVYLGAFCGMRLGEMIALAPGDVDFEAGEIAITKNLTQYDELKGPKSRAGVRTVPMPQRVATVLLNWFQNWHRPNPRNLLFTMGHNDPTRVWASNFSKLWWRLLDRCDLADAPGRYHFHALRHFYISWLQHNGHALAGVAKLAGHSDPAITLGVYTHSLGSAASDRASVERIASLLPAPDARVTQGVASA